MCHTTIGKEGSIRLRVPAVSLAHAKWSVMWLKGGRILERKFDHDLAEAVKVYSLLQKSGRKAVTLRCTNVGFPPPERLVKDPVVDIVKRGRKKYKRTQYVNHMREFNHKGIYWCPYCMKLRRFEQRVDEERIRMFCPMCDISTRDGHVRRWNPIAIEMDYRKRGRRGSKRRRRGS